MVFNRITLIGGGKMGLGLAIRMAKRGCHVVIRELSAEMENAKLALADRLQKAVDAEKLKPQKRDEILKLICWTDDYHHACQETCPDLVIDATTENYDIKVEVVTEVRKYYNGPLGTISSALPIMKMGFDINFHPMSPADINRGLELGVHKDTPDGLEQKLWDFAIEIGLSPVPIDTNQPGLAVNGVFVPALLKACEMRESGINIPTIEKAFKRATGIKVGPFHLMNFTGVPITKLAAVPMQVIGEWVVIPQKLTDQIAAKQDWDLSGEVDDSKIEELADIFRGLIFANALRVVPDVHRGWHDLRRLFEICLKWPKGPAELMSDLGKEQVTKLVQAYMADNPSFPEVEVPEDFDDLIKTQWWLVNTNEETGEATLTLNCPEHLGALSSEKLEELAQRIDELDELQEAGTCRICRVQSACGNFAGADIKELLDLAKDKGNPDGLSGHMTDGCETFGKFRQSRIVFIGVVHGEKKVVLGGGAELFASLDFKITTDTTKFGFPEMKAVGCVPGWDGIPNMVWGNGRVRAATALFQPWKVFTGQKAVDLGFVNEVFKADKFDDSLSQLIEGLLQCAPDALTAQKKLLWYAANFYDNDFDEVTSQVTREMKTLLTGEEAINRMTAFAGGKRKAAKK